jgi:hypothetical protein
LIPNGHLEEEKATSPSAAKAKKETKVEKAEETKETKKETVKAEDIPF